MLDENDTDTPTTSIDAASEPNAGAGPDTGSAVPGQDADGDPATPSGPAEPTEPAEAPPVAKKAARKRTTRTTTAKRVGTKKAAATDSDTDQPVLPLEAAPLSSEDASDESAATRSAAAADPTAGDDASAGDAATGGADGSTGDADGSTGDADGSTGDADGSTGETATGDADGSTGDAVVVAPRKRTARKTTAKKVAAKKAPAKRATKKSAAADPVATGPDASSGESAEAEAPGALDALTALGGSADPLAEPLAEDADSSSVTDPREAQDPGEATEDQSVGLDRAPTSRPTQVASAPSLLFKAPDPVSATSRRRSGAAPAPASAEEDEAAADIAGLQQVPAEAASGDAEPGGEPAGTRADGKGADRTPAETDDGGTDDTDGFGTATDDTDDTGSDEADDTEDTEDGQGSNRRRRRRGGRRRRRSGGGDDADGESTDQSQAASEDKPGAEGEDDSSGGGRGSGRRGQGNGRKRESGQKESGQKESGQTESGQNASDDRGQDTSGPDDEADADEQGEGSGSRRRRRRRRTGEEPDAGQEDPQNTVTRVRKPRNAQDEITALHGSTRLEAKKQRRREGREAGRRRAPIVSEAEFLARREAVDRVMVIRQRADLTQIAVLEDQVLVEHYVARESQTSLIGNVYLGRVQNVLPSMEAAFIDIGKGRNAVLYAGEVNWDSLGAGNGPRKIESVLKSGQPILVQVSKDPIGHKGARLTSQISLPGRFLVYVPDGTTSGISRKLPDIERTRLKTLLKEIVPDSAGVIVRTAAEGASEDELTLDVERLTARWADIESKLEKGREKAGGPQLLYGEPDLTLKVVRDLFTEDFGKLVVSGDEAWDMVDTYVKHVAPDLEDRLERYSDSAQDVFAAYRIDEQIAKGLDRKVWLPSGGSLIIDRTEAMTVVDVNTGKFTGSGGNLEETVTKNNLEAAEEMIRQLRLRDIGGIIVVDFIDMVLESNRDLVLRRLVECLGRDRTRHQVAEVTSLGLVQMTRKRIGTGLLEAFSENCEQCQGRGLIVHHEPVEAHRGQDDEPRRGRRGRGRGSDGPDSGSGSSGSGSRGGGSVAPRPSPSPKDIAAIAKHDHRPVDDATVSPPVEQVPTPVGQLPDTSPEQDVSDAAGPDVSVVDEPAVVAPETAGPASGQPEVTQSELTQSEVTQPELTKSDLTQPEVTQPEVTQPEVPPSTAAQSGVAQSGVAQSGVALPGVADSEDAQPEPQAPPVPKGPILVTSTRRRVARRPAGSATPAPRPEPAAQSAQDPEAVPAAQPEPSQPAGSAGEAHVEQPAGSDGAARVEQPAGPVLVTSTRRRVVRRPAGPPAGAELGGPGSVRTTGGALTDGSAHGESHAESNGSSDVPSGLPEDSDGHAESAHVPVKKKGSRKR